MATAMDNAKVLEAAMEYAERGWRVIPCDVGKKHPPIKGWHEHATTDADLIEEWFTGRYQSAGVSLVFGPASGIVDIDVDATEDGDKLCHLAFGGEWPQTPTYLSGRKKTPHRLFRYSADLPAQANLDLRRVCGLDVDLKIGHENRGSHSLAPPSSGYQWLPGLTPDDCTPAELPESFLVWLHNVALGGIAADGPRRKSAEEWAELAAGVREGGRNESLASLVGGMARQWDDLETREGLGLFMSAVRGWNLGNQPPLDDEELQRTVVSIVKKERHRRAQEDFSRAANPSAESAVTGAQNRSEFAMVIIEGEPSLYELHSDNFRESPNGCVRLTAEQCISGNAVRVQALKQANFVLPSSFVKAWGKKGGLLEVLIGTADRRKGDPGEHRSAIVAQSVLTLIERAKTASDDDKPDPRGRPTRLSDGSVMFGVQWISSELQFLPDKPTRSEVVDVLAKCGGKKTRPLLDGERPRFWRLSKRGLERIRVLAWPDVVHPYGEKK